MKRFYKDVATSRTDLGWTVSLDGRPIKTQGGNPQVVPSEQLANMLAREWRDQGETIDPAGFRARDLTDYAIDVVAPDASGLIEKLLGYAETDTLCYRAEPEEALFRRQHEVWEPIVESLERREQLTLQRISGIIHRPQSDDTMTKLSTMLSRLDHFTLAALEQTTSLASSLCIGIESIRSESDGEKLWDAANLEEDWQAELWGKDEEASARRERRKGDFLHAMQFVRALNH